MHSFSIFALLLCVALSYSAPDGANYPTQYDNINLDEILSNKRLIEGYVKCINDNIGCSGAGRALRESLPDALKTNCSKCNDKQKAGAIKVMKVLEKDHPELWKKVLDKYDSDRKLITAFKKQNNY